MSHSKVKCATWSLILTPRCFQFSQEALLGGTPLHQFHFDCNRHRLLKHEQMTAIEWEEALITQQSHTALHRLTQITVTTIALHSNTTFRCILHNGFETVGCTPNESQMVCIGTLQHCTLHQVLTSPTNTHSTLLYVHTV